MITPEYLNEVMYGVEEKLSMVNEAILKIIVERITASFKKGEDDLFIPSTISDMRKLIQNGVLYEDVQKAVMESLPLIQEAIKEAFYKSAAEITKQNYDAIQKIIDAEEITTVKVPEYIDDAIAKRAAELNMSKSELRQLEQAYKRTNGEMKNLTRSKALKCQETFINACDNADMKVKSGVSVQAAIIAAIKEVSEKGVQVVNYRNGKTEDIEVAIARAVRTGINQANACIVIEECVKIGINYVKTSAHLGARVTKENDYTNHSWWQGKIYAINWDNPAFSETIKNIIPEDEKEQWKKDLKKELEKKQKKYDYPDFIESTGYGNILGLCGINCRHSCYIYYPSEKIDNKLAFGSEKNEKRYNLEQQQRRMERAIRKTKRKLAGLNAAGMDNDEEMRIAKAETRELLRKQSDKYIDFCEANKLKPSSWRQETVGNTKKSGAVFSGALNDINDPLGTKRAIHAEKYYNSIINRDKNTIINKLSMNGNIEISEAENVYKHVFENEHIFKSGDIKKFEPDYDMAQSFQRILEGKDIKPHDYTLLKHEILEFEIMSKYNMAYEDAHAIAEKQYNYSQELEEFLRKG